MPLHPDEITIPGGREDEARAFYGGLLGLAPGSVTYVVDAWEGLRVRLEQADVETRDAPPLRGRRRFRAWDPFGNRLEFVEGPAAH